LSSQETRNCLLRLRIPLENIKEAVEIVLPVGNDQAVANRIVERAAKLIQAAYEKDRLALYGYKPSVLMAAAIYLAGRMDTGVNISQTKIAKALNIRQLSLKIRASLIESLLGLEITNLHYRHKRYVCPLCGEAFNYLIDLKTHLWNKRIKSSDSLKVYMFNEDGILVDEKVLKRIKRYTEEG